jgi:Trk K+ transport system NAD-binding subunit
VPSAVVLGSDRLALRVAEQLRRDGYEVRLLALAGSALARSAAGLGVPAEVRSREEATQSGAGADVLLAITEEDELNLGAALVAREARPELRVVLRQFNLRLGALLGRAFTDGDVLSLSALCAPSFAVAALAPGVVFAHDCGGALFVLREADAPAPGVVVASAREDGAVEWSPAPGTLRSGARCLVASDAAGLPRHAPRAASGPAPPRGGATRPSLLRATLLALLALLAAGALVFGARLGLRALDAVYFLVTILTTVGFGDYNLKDADDLTKALGIGVMLAGFLLGALLVAQLTEALVARQDARRRGLVRRRRAGHVVVCGLGSVGYRTAATLKRLGQRVVAVEADENGRFVPRARADGLELVIGDAADERTLAFAGLATARALVVATSRDHLNLEVGLLARSLAPELPVVLRLFDAELARRVAATFGLTQSMSAGALAAGRFTALGANADRLACLRFAGAPYEVRQARPRAGEAVGAAAGPGGRVAAVVRADGTLELDPAPARPAAAGETLLVVAPQSVAGGDAPDPAR